MPEPLHPDLAPLECLLGGWAGEGTGEYPTIEPFRYSEQVTFGHVGKPFLAYRQATVNIATGLPAHAESGYWRAVGGGEIEVVLAHPSGFVEITRGRVRPTADGLKLHLRSDCVDRTPTAKEVLTLERQVEVAGDVLRYDLAMSAVGQPHQHHLHADLHRTSPS